ncbi:MAG: CotH kinase family protein [Prolixibacteraceae bacterium]|nr:CotH kinase family protein [Prolixibacteraceae bacterium]
MKYLSFILLFILSVNLSGQQPLSSNLPIVIINTSGQNIKDEPKITAQMKIVYNGENERNSINDSSYNYNGYIGIELRGNSSLSFNQKQYTLETRDASGQNLDATLLGMPAENDWVLYAPYNDYSLIRNVIAYHLWNMMGYWAPRTKMVELVLNDDYQGVYVLTETIKKDDNRLNISKLNPTDTSGLELTGGYIMRIDVSNNDDDLTFNSKVKGIGTVANKTVTWLHHYPKPDEIHPLQTEYIRKYIDTVELLIQSPEYADPVNGYSKFIEVQSFVDYFIHSELALNADGYKRSAYFYKEKMKNDGTGGKLHAGPVWDYNLAFGICNFCNGNKINSWGYEGCETNPTPAMWQRLIQDPAFCNEVKCRYKELRDNILSEEYLYSFIDNQASLLQEAQARHFEKWDELFDNESGFPWGGGMWGGMGGNLWFNAYSVESYAEEISVIKQWLSDRLKFLDENLPGECLVSDNHIDLEDKILIFPNPFTDFIYIESDTPITGFDIYDISGEKIFGKSINKQNNIIIDDFIYLPGKTYILSIYTSEGQIVNRKVLKE